MQQRKFDGLEDLGLPVQPAQCKTRFQFKLTLHVLMCSNLLNDDESHGIL